MKRKLLFIVNQPSTLLDFRVPIAVQAIQDGYEVHVATNNDEGVDRIREIGCAHHFLSLSRSGTNLFSELRLIYQIYILMRNIKPCLVHLVTIKPVLYGGIAARLAGVPSVVSAVSGLGFVFINGGFKAAIVRQLVAVLYRLALGKSNLRVIFQNEDDQEKVGQLAGLVTGKSVLIRGSGVDLEKYIYQPEPTGELLVIMAARLLKDKGVFEFVDAARVLKRADVRARFCLAGALDPNNPASCTELDLQMWRDEGVVEVLGYRSDIAKLFSNSHVVVLPSYREGLPKVLIEAAACGRAVVTTNVPGCRDAVIPDKTGLLVPVRDSVSLAAAIERLLLDTELRQRMGQAGRVLAEQYFDIREVVSKHMQIYHELSRSTL